LLDIARHPVRPRAERGAIILAGGRVVAGERGQEIFDGHVVVRAGLIETIEPGPPSSLPSDVRAVVDCGGGWVLPGLINAHDHLEFSCFPRIGPRAEAGHARHYADWREWAADVTARRAEPEIASAMAIPHPTRIVAGAYRNLLSGVTSVAHHGHDGGWLRPLRLGLPVRLVAHGFHHALSDLARPAGRRLGAQSLADATAGLLDARRSHDGTPPDRPWIIHLGEGSTAAYQSELRRLADVGCVTPRTTIVHGVALGASDVRLLAATGASLVWCPASNVFLYGRTAPVDLCLEAGVPVALGTDAPISGSPHLLDELRSAHGTHLAAASDVLAMVTHGGAGALGMRNSRGALVVGRAADVIVVRRPARGEPAGRRKNFTAEGTAEDMGPGLGLGLGLEPRAAARDLLRAQPDDVRLVMVGGVPLVAAAEHAACLSQSLPRHTIVRRRAGDGPWRIAGHPARVTPSLDLAFR